MFRLSVIVKWSQTSTFNFFLNTIGSWIHLRKRYIHLLSNSFKIMGVTIKCLIVQLWYSLLFVVGISSKAENCTSLLVILACLALCWRTENREHANFFTIEPKPTFYSSYSGTVCTIFVCWHVAGVCVCIVSVVCVIWEALIHTLFVKGNMNRLFNLVISCICLSVWNIA